MATATAGTDAKKQGDDSSSEASLAGALISPLRDPRLASLQAASEDNVQSKTDNLGVRSSPEKRSSVAPVESDQSLQSYGHSFIQSLGALTSEILLISSATSEQDKLKKSIEFTQGDQKKAKALAQFPSTAAAFQQNRQDQDNELLQVEKILQQHQTLRTELENTVAAMINASIQPKDTEWQEKCRKALSEAKDARYLTESIQKEVTYIKRDIRRLETETVFKKDFTERVCRLEDKADILDKSFVNASNRLASWTKDVKDVQEKATRVAEKLDSTHSVSSDAYKRVGKMEETILSIQSNLQSFPTIRVAYNDLADQVAGLKDLNATLQTNMTEGINRLNNRLTLLHQSSISSDDFTRMKDFANVSQTALENIKYRIAILEKAVNFSNVNDSKIPCRASENPCEKQQDVSKDIETRLQTLESSSIASFNGASLQSGKSLDALKTEMDLLAQQFKQMHDLQAMKDDLEFSNLEEVKQELGKHAELLNKAKVDYDGLSSQLNSLKQAIPVEFLRGMNEHARSIKTLMDTFDNRLQTVETAIHSLETRYNSLTTEPLARHILRIMQEFYPSTATVMQQVTSLKAQLTKTTNSISDMSNLTLQLDQAVRGQATLAEQVQHDQNLQAGELGSLGERLTAMSQQLEKMWHQLETATKDIPGLRDHFDTLNLNVNEHVFRIDQDLKSQVESQQEVLQNIAKERDRVIGQVESLTKQVSEVKTTAADNIKAIDEKIGSVNSIDAKDLFDRVCKLEESNANQIQLLASFKDVKETTQKDFSDAVRRLESLEQAKDHLERIACNSEFVVMPPELSSASQTSSSPSRQIKSEIDSELQNCGDLAMIDKRQFGTHDSNLSNGNHTMKRLRKRKRDYRLSDEERMEFRSPQSMASNSPSSRSTASQESTLLKHTNGQDPSPNLRDKEKKRLKRKRRVFDVISLDD